MPKLLTTSYCILAFFAIAAAPGPAPAPAAESCTALLPTMIDCLEFLLDEENVTKPSSACCSKYKTVVATDAACICAALAASSSLGLQIDMPRADALSSYCGVTGFSISSCPVSNGPSISPGERTQPPAPTESASMEAPAAAHKSSGVISVSATISVISGIFISIVTV